MTDKKDTATGFPVRKQLIGGFNKTDVVEYVENIVAEVEIEREENENRKQQFYELIKNGQDFCNDLAAQARKDADTLMEETQQKADTLMQAANEELRRLREERGQLLTQTHTEMKKLADIVAQQQQQSAQTYENMLRPIMMLLNSLEGDDNGSGFKDDQAKSPAGKAFQQQG